MPSTASVSDKRNEANGQVGFDFDSLWDEPEHAEQQVPDRPEWSKRDKLAFEREMLGLYVSDHPLAGLEIAARQARERRRSPSCSAATSRATAST